MALLSLKKRKEFFKALNLGEYNRENILKLQRKYFIRHKDIDGVYGKNTDILLRHVYNVLMYSDNFTPDEFRCECCGKYCTGYPDRMRARTIKLAQQIRTFYAKPMYITSGLRCRKINNMLAGSASQSKHLKGMAIDYYIQGRTDSLTARKITINTVKTFPEHEYSYGNGIDSNGNHPSAVYMGNAIHSQIK